MSPMARRAGWVAGAIAGAALLAVPASRGARSLMMTRRAVATFVAILAAADDQDLDAIRPLCTDRYLRARPPAPSPGGGVVGFPRGIHQNFQAWREGAEVWLCPTDRVGPVYRFSFEGGACRFDGLVGLLRPGGRVERATGPAGELF